MDTTSADLVALNLRIDTSVKEIMKDGKIDKHDIPVLVLLMTDIVLTPNASVKLSDDQIMTKMDQMYDYIMTQYKLYPANEVDKTAFKQLFDISVELVLFQPNLKALKKKCLPCFF
jgi:hypothetical protein